MRQFRMIRRALIAAAFLLPVVGIQMAHAEGGIALEVVISKPKPGVSLETLLEADKTMELEFVSKQMGFIDREVAVSEDGEVFVVVRWETLDDANAAAEAFMNDPTAQARLELSDASLFKHYVVQ